MKKVIWVIDDDHFDHLIAQKMVEIYLPGMVVRPYTSAESALRDLPNHSEEIALILLDLVMPVMNGFEFLFEFAKLNISIPVYIVSNSLNPNDEQKAMENPLAKAFFGKPLLEESVFRIARDNLLTFQPT